MLYCLHKTTANLIFDYYFYSFSPSFFHTQLLKSAESMAIPRHAFCMFICCNRTQCTALLRPRQTRGYWSGTLAICPAHYQRVLAGLVVISFAPAQRDEPEALVQGDGAGIRFAHLQREQL